MKLVDVNLILQDIKDYRHRKFFLFCIGKVCLESIDYYVARADYCIVTNSSALTGDEWDEEVKPFSPGWLITAIVLNEEDKTYIMIRGNNKIYSFEFKDYEELIEQYEALIKELKTMDTIVNYEQLDNIINNTRRNSNGKHT